MEESEKRRERLRAMRSEASQAGASSKIGSDFHQLSNPLIESAVNPYIQANSPGTTRFDYYTDPMAAFSNNKRMSKGSYQNSPGSFNRFPTPRNPEMAPSPAHQMRPSYSPDPSMDHPQSSYYSPRPMHPTTTPSPAHHAYSPEPRMFRPQSPYRSSGPVNLGMPLSPAHQVQPPYSPNPRMYQQPRDPYYKSGPRNPPMSPSPSLTHQGQSGHFQPRGPYNNSYANSSPSFRGTPSSGRGRSGLGRGGNRGFGSHGSVSAELRPDLYYNKSMLEDPWINLEPSIWKSEDISEKGFNTSDSRTFSHLDTFGIKKARISEASKASGSSQPSLAEYLAAAFNEAVGKEGNKEN